MVTRIARGWFQCPDSGDEVCVTVYAAPTRAQANPTSRLVDANDPATLRWCDAFNGTGSVGMNYALENLRYLRVEPIFDVNWE